MSNPCPGPGDRFKPGDDDRRNMNGRTPGIAKIWNDEAGRDLPTIVARTNLADLIITQLGGEDAIGAVKMVLVERFAFLAVYARQLEERIAEGMSHDKEEKAVGRLTALLNALKGTANSVGLNKVDEIEALYRTVG